MSKIIKAISVIFILNLSNLYAQNVGIGNSNPTYKLDVAGLLRLQNSSTTAGLWFDGTSLGTRSFIGTLNDNHFGIYGNAGAGWNFLINNTNNNIGIGTSTPLFRLDINGRIRLQNDTNTAGIWFDGNTIQTRSFIGTMNDNYCGIYGSGGTGWNFVMDVANGNTGIGTTSPTQKLDLNGTLRIGSDSPIKGSILTSKDQNGNAEWANAVAFKAEGTINNVDLTIPNNTWTKIQFNQSPVYNLGNDYLPASSEFLVAENGIYEFNSGVLINLVHTKSESIRVLLQRNGVTSEIGQLHNKGIFKSNSAFSFNEDLKILVEANLIVGDKVWVEVYQTPWNSSANNKVSSNTSRTYFSGNIVSRI